MEAHIQKIVKLAEDIQKFHVFHSPKNSETGLLLTPVLRDLKKAAVETAAWAGLGFSISTNSHKHILALLESAEVICRHDLTKRAEIIGTFNWRKALDLLDRKQKALAVGRGLMEAPTQPVSVSRAPATLQLAGLEGAGA